jgi:hypothetical protein
MWVSNQQWALQRDKRISELRLKKEEAEKQAAPLKPQISQHAKNLPWDHNYFFTLVHLFVEVWFYTSVSV